MYYFFKPQFLNDHVLDKQIASVDNKSSLHSKNHLFSGYVLCLSIKPAIMSGNMVFVAQRHTQLYKNTDKSRQTNQQQTDRNSSTISLIKHI